ncbi:alpha-L-arabinofuranosidase [Flavobacterium akiainvivens]|uniref:non-reducing end alpha-L-arabinofuranosidase n=1 Tax=Flavobacterium akiainvivens TaxID=1202724 RepID=A0A0M9VJY1_9FLAO|nr:alpha-L-arabinofuranosidase C-terminal domain-containing protein [Flavobacterium akiainvivens]KOS08269.1 alpha-L-arabinofuranosidase [Flavobacterium akiainvivens]SFQ54850.1 alpha-N-arabinofuranosidase [Flavobacterium akiainvivens]
MKTNFVSNAALALALSGSLLCTAQQKNSYVLDLKNTGVKIQPTMYGIFFEDINLGADGGLYAELVKNRSFEFANPMMGWSQPNSDKHSLNEKSGYATVIKTEKEINRHMIRVEVNNAAGYSLVNEGFRGMGIKANDTYNVSFMGAAQSGSISKIKFQLVDEKGGVIGETTISVSGKDWKTYKGQIKATKTDAKGQLKITFDNTGVFNMDMISIFPKDTWNGRENGLRKDMAQKLYDLNPGFLRFPGGCIVEGRTLEQRYQWKKSIGPVEDREMIINRWNVEFGHKQTPDYFQTFGLGFFEYFQLSEDLGAEPLPVLSCGIACQFNTGELAPMAELDPFVQDAVDLIEFANGAVTTTWGKKRAEMGHPQPFNLKFIGVGNEQWGPDYIERYKVFEKAIHAKYPNIKIISTSGPFPTGEHFDYAWKELKALNAQIIDEHYYAKPEWFKQNVTRYDNYDRKGPKVFAGEYAAQTVAIASPENKNNWEAALSEAAFMTGLERNAEVVHMTSYAPLFAHVEGWQWTPDLIWVDNLNSFATPNYYVQQLYGQNPGTDLVSITTGGKAITGQNGMYATAVTDAATGEVIVKVVNTTAKAQKTDIAVKGKKLAKEGKMIMLQSDDLQAENNFTSEKVTPKTSTFTLNGSKIDVEIPAQAVVVFRVKIK